MLQEGLHEQHDRFSHELLLRKQRLRTPMKAPMIRTIKASKLLILHAEIAAVVVYEPNLHGYVLVWSCCCIKV